MISFRYHIVTIIAVFLALAIGLLGGAAFVQPALQEQLQDQTDRLRNDLEDRTQQIGDLRDQMAALNGFADSVMPYLTTGKLTGTPVVLVTQTGVEDDYRSMRPVTVIMKWPNGPVSSFNSAAVRASVQYMAVLAHPNRDNFAQGVKAHEDARRFYNGIQ